MWGNFFLKILFRCTTHMEISKSEEIMSISSCNPATFNTEHWDSDKTKWIKWQAKAKTYFMGSNALPRAFFYKTVVLFPKTRKKNSKYFPSSRECGLVPKETSEVKQNKVRKTLLKIQALGNGNQPETTVLWNCHLSPFSVCWPEKLATHSFRF